MEMLISAAIGDLASRSMTFMVEKYCKQPSAEENLRRLQQLLLRIRIIVEEAEGRHVTKQGMLQQLKNLRDEMFKGCYLLDTVRYQAIQDKAGDEEVSHSFALSGFNPAKRLRFPTSRNSQWMVFGSGKVEHLQKMIRSLEGTIADMKEFIIFLTQNPPIYRRPYSAHLFLDKCVFGRHTKRERVIDFLLKTEAPGSEGLGVLPIVGPAQIGKSTLVEHVCVDERVRGYFSLILFYNGSVLKDETTSTLRDCCIIKHQNHASHKRLLLIFELSGYVDEETWRRLHSLSEICMARRSKIVITSRHENIEKITNFGTTQALRLRPLPCEAYWYFFKVRVFGSTDPQEHAKLASIAMEIANEMRGSFLYANVIGVLPFSRSNVLEGVTGSRFGNLRLVVVSCLLIYGSVVL